MQMQVFDDPDVLNTVLMLDLCYNCQLSVFNGSMLVGYLTHKWIFFFCRASHTHTHTHAHTHTYTERERGQNNCDEGGALYYITTLLFID